MQLAAVWLATAEPCAQALCLLEAQLITGGLAAAQQVSLRPAKSSMCSGSPAAHAEGLVPLHWAVTG